MSAGGSLSLARILVRTSQSAKHCCFATVVGTISIQRGRQIGLPGERQRVDFEHAGQRVARRDCIKRCHRHGSANGPNHMSRCRIRAWLRRGGTRGLHGQPWSIRYRRGSGRGQGEWSNAGKRRFPRPVGRAVAAGSRPGASGTPPSASAVAETDVSMIAVGTPSAPSGALDRLPSSGWRGDRSRVAPRRRLSAPWWCAAPSCRARPWSNRASGFGAGLGHGEPARLRSGHESRIPARGQQRTRLFEASRKQ